MIKRRLTLRPPGFFRRHWPFFAILAWFLFLMFVGRVYPATARPVDTYAHISVCSPDLLLCRVEPPVRFDLWDDCEWYLVQRRTTGNAIVLGKCRSWSPAPDWREE